MTATLTPKLVGARVKRVEDRRLLTGQGHYVDDHRPPRTLHAAFLRSPHGHARIVRIDATAALAAPWMSRIVALGRAASMPASTAARTVSSILRCAGSGAPTTVVRHMSPW